MAKRKEEFDWSLTWGPACVAPTIASDSEAPRIQIARRGSFLPVNSSLGSTTRSFHRSQEETSDSYRRCSYLDHPHPHRSGSSVAPSTPEFVPVWVDCNLLLTPE